MAVLKRETYFYCNWLIVYKSSDGLVQILTDGEFVLVVLHFQTNRVRGHHFLRHEEKGQPGDVPASVSPQPYPIGNVDFSEILSR